VRNLPISASSTTTTQPSTDFLRSVATHLNNAFRHSSPGDLVHVDFLKKKSIAPKAFMHYCTAIRMPKAVRTDGGAELIAGTWKAFCEQHQIRQEQSPCSTLSIRPSLILLVFCCENRHPPCIRHIRTFGARAYVRQRKDQRGKLGPRAKLGILVGFDPNTKDGYVVWFPDDRQFVM